jgi:hypothetical protein
MAEKANPLLWQKIVDKIMLEDVAGTKKGNWSARKAQLAVKRYKEAGGKYKGEKSSNNSLVKWTKQEWTTKSGKPSSQTGERYLPKKAIDALSDKDYARSTRLKREATKKGEQYSKQPDDIVNSIKKYR